MPRVQRRRWRMQSASDTGASPAASGRRRKALSQRRRCSRSEVCASSVSDWVAKPPTSSRAVRRSTAQEPENIAAFQVSLPSWIRAWNSALSAGMGRDGARLRWNGSCVRKCCGVCTSARFGSATSQPIVNCRKARVGTWSQSNTATNSPSAWSSAWLRLPALAWRRSARARYSQPAACAKSRNSGRSPSSSSQTRSRSGGQSIASAASMVARTTASGSSIVGISTSTLGHSAGLPGSGSGCRRSGHTVCA